MASVGFILITILIGLVILGFSYFWQAWILENSPRIPKERGPLQFRLVFMLLWSCWFLAFSFTHQDLIPGKKTPDNVPSEITMATYAMCCIGVFALVLFWDCFARGPAPHIVPTFSLFLALLFTCGMVVPGLTLLSQYVKHRDNAGPNQEYIDRLKGKGIVGVSIGSLVNVIALTIWIRFRVVKAALARDREENYLP